MVGSNIATNGRLLYWPPATLGASRTTARGLAPLSVGSAVLHNGDRIVGTILPRYLGTYLHRGTAGIVYVCMHTQYIQGSSLSKKKKKSQVDQIELPDDAYKNVAPQRGCSVSPLSARELMRCGVLKGATRGA